MLTLAAWLHNLDPFAIKFPDGFILQGIRWYGLAYLTAFAAGYLFTLRVARAGVSTLRRGEVMDFVISVALGVVVGGRLGYVFFYKPELLIDFHGEFPFWGVLQLNKGGMSSHGGMIGVGLVVWWYAWRSRRKTMSLDPVAANAPDRIDGKGHVADHTRCIDCGYDLHSVSAAANCPECGAAVKSSLFTHRWLHLFDLTTPAAAVGFFFGRIANFINAELIGRVCSADLPWAVKFPQELFDLSRAWIKGGSDAPLLDLAPAAENVGVSAAQWTEAVAHGDVVTVERTIEKIIAAIQDGGSRGGLIGEQVAPLLQPHHPSQLYAAVTEGLIVFIVLAWLWRKPRKPGVLAGAFGALYGLMRIINEFYRTPDAHIADQEFAAIGLTRGQLLSAALALASVVLLWWCARRKAPRMGGWRNDGGIRVGDGVFSSEV